MIWLMLLTLRLVFAQVEYPLPEGIPFETKFVAPLHNQPEQYLDAIQQAHMLAFGLAESLCDDVRRFLTDVDDLKANSILSDPFDMIQISRMVRMTITERNLWMYFSQSLSELQRHRRPSSSVYPLMFEILRFLYRERAILHFIAAQDKGSKNVLSTEQKQIGGQLTNALGKVDMRFPPNRFAAKEIRYARKIITDRINELEQKSGAHKFVKDMIDLVGALRAKNTGSLSAIVRRWTKFWNEFEGSMKANEIRAEYGAPDMVVAQRHRNFLRVLRLFALLMPIVQGNSAFFENAKAMMITLIKYEPPEWLVPPPVNINNRDRDLWYWNIEKLISKQLKEMVDAMPENPFIVDQIFSMTRNRILQVHIPAVSAYNFDWLVTSLRLRSMHQAIVNRLRELQAESQLAEDDLKPTMDLLITSLNIVEDDYQPPEEPEKPTSTAARRDDHGIGASTSQNKNEVEEFIPIRKGPKTKTRKAMLNTLEEPSQRTPTSQELLQQELQRLAQIKELCEDVGGERYLASGRFRSRSPLFENTFTQTKDQLTTHLDPNRRGRIVELDLREMFMLCQLTSHLKGAGTLRWQNVLGLFTHMGAQIQPLLGSKVQVIFPKLSNDDDDDDDNAKTASGKTLYVTRVFHAPHEAQLNQLAPAVATFLKNQLRLDLSQFEYKP